MTIGRNMSSILPAPLSLSLSLYLSLSLCLTQDPVILGRNFFEIRVLFAVESWLPSTCPTPSLRWDFTMSFVSVCTYLSRFNISCHLLASEWQWPRSVVTFFFFPHCQEREYLQSGSNADQLSWWHTASERLSAHFLLSVYLSVCLSVCLPICLSAYLSVCLSICVGKN